MRFVLSIIVYLMQFIFVYIAGFILSFNDENGRYPGNIISPKWIKGFAEPKFLLPESVTGNYSMRILGIGYHIVLGISTVFLLPIFIILLFVDYELATKASTIWYYSAYLIAAAVLVIDGIIKVTYEVIVLFRKKSR